MTEILHIYYYFDFRIRFTREMPEFRTRKSRLTCRVLRTKLSLGQFCEWFTSPFPKFVRHSPYPHSVDWWGVGASSSSPSDSTDRVVLKFASLFARIESINKCVRGTCFRFRLVKTKTVIGSNGTRLDTDVFELAVISRIWKQRQITVFEKRLKNTPPVCSIRLI